MKYKVKLLPLPPIIEVIPITITSIITGIAKPVASLIVLAKQEIRVSKIVKINTVIIIIANICAYCANPYIDIVTLFVPISFGYDKIVSINENGDENNGHYMRQNVVRLCIRLSFKIKT